MSRSLATWGETSLPKYGDDNEVSTQDSCDDGIGPDLSSPAITMPELAERFATAAIACGRQRLLQRTKETMDT